MLGVARNGDWSAALASARSRARLRTVQLMMHSVLVVLAVALVIPCMAQTPRMPDVEAQRAAMKKLGFLIGKWSGEARRLGQAGAPVELIQTESAEYKLDGLLLVIEGVGRTKDGGKLELQAFGMISYDDATSTYRMRAFNDGRWVETEVKLIDVGQGITWGISFGDIKTKSVLRINEKGEWTELTELTIGAQSPLKYMELTVRRQK